MKFTELDSRMRKFELFRGALVPYNSYIIIRVDGRSFSHLTREVLNCEAPFDLGFHEHMDHTTRKLMESGFRTVYGYTQSDEISILLAREDDTFGRKMYKLLSIFAGEASAHFSARAGVAATFDSRISVLPTDDDVVDYFRWRAEDAFRNGLHGYCYWLLRKQGMNAREATQHLHRVGNAGKHELLFKEGINFATEVPAWQRRGIGFYWDPIVKERSLNTETLEERMVLYERRPLRREEELPVREEYAEFIRERIADGS